MANRPWGVAVGLPFSHPLNLPFLEDSLLPSMDEIIAWYKGRTTSTALLQNYTGTHDHPQVKGTSAEGDGTLYGAITGLLTSATFTVGTGSDEPTCTVNGQLAIASGDNVWDLKIYHAGVLFADLAMICKESETEWDISGNDNHCVWTSGPVGGPIVEHTDGTGSNRANLIGFSIADSATYIDSGQVTQITEDSRYPAGQGYDGSGVAIATQYPGPIAPDLTPMYMPCLQGDGTGDVPLDSNITLTDFTMRATGVMGDASTDQRVILGRSDSTDDVIRFLAVDRVGVSFSGTSYTLIHDDDVWEQGDRFDITVERSSTTLTVTDNITGWTDNTTCVTDNFVINSLLERQGNDRWDGELHDIKIYNAAGTLIHHWPMVGGHPNTNYLTDTSTVTMVEDIVGGNHGTATSFVGTCWGTRELYPKVDHVEPAELLVNGGFDGDADGWSLEGGWTYGSNAVSNDGTTDWTAKQAGILTIGHEYTVSVEVTAYTSGELNFRDGTSWIGTSITAADVYTFTFIATGADFQLYPSGTSPIFTVDNVSLKRIIQADDYDNPSAYILSQGMSVDRVDAVTDETIYGFNAVNESGTHQDGTSPRYKADTFALAKQLPNHFRLPWGPEFQSLAQGTDGGAIYLCDEPTVGENNQIFIGDTGLAIYDEDQLDQIVAIDGRLVVLGAELVDAQTSATWQAQGTNTDDDEDDGSYSVTYNDVGGSASGSRLVLRDSVALTGDLTVGNEYVVVLNTKVNTGSVTVRIWNGAANVEGETITSTSYVAYIHRFTAYDTTGCFIQTAGLSSGETIYFKDVSVKPISADLGPELVTGGTMADGATEPTMNGVSLGVSNATLSVSNEQAHAGSYSLKVTKTNTTEYAAFRFLDGSNCGLRGEVGGTAPHRKSVWVYLPSGQTVDTLKLRWRNNAGSYATLMSTTLTDQWVELYGDFENDDAQRVLVVVAENDTVSGEVWYVDQLSCREVLSGGT